MNARNFAKLIPAVLVVTALSVACSKEDPTATPATPTTTTAPTGTPPADEAATAKEVDDLAKEIEADLADEG